MTAPASCDGLSLLYVMAKLDGWGIAVELRTVDGRLKLGGVFKLVATGYGIAAGVIFVPLFALITLVGLASGAPVKVNGEIVEGGAGQAFALIPLVMVPIIVAMQAVLFGGLVVFGLWLYQKRRPLRVVAEDGPLPS